MDFKKVIQPNQLFEGKVGGDGRMIRSSGANIGAVAARPMIHGSEYLIQTAVSSVGSSCLIDLDDTTRREIRFERSFVRTRGSERIAVTDDDRWGIIGPEFSPLRQQHSTNLCVRVWIACLVVTMRQMRVEKPKFVAGTRTRNDTKLSPCKSSRRIIVPRDVHGSAVDWLESVGVVQNVILGTGSREQCIAGLRGEFIRILTFLYAN